MAAGSGPTSFRAEVIFLETPHRLRIDCALAGDTFTADWRTTPLHVGSAGPAAAADARGAGDDALDHFFFLRDLADARLFAFWIADTSSAFDILERPATSSFLATS